MRRKSKNCQLFDYKRSRTGVRLKYWMTSSETIQSSESRPVPEARHIGAFFWKCIKGLGVVMTILTPFMPEIKEFLLRHIFFIYKGRNRIGFFYLQAI